MADTYPNSVVLYSATVLGYVCLAAYLLQSCRSFRRPGARQAAARVRAWLLGSSLPGEELLDAKVWKLIERERVRSAQRYAYPFMHLFALGLATSVAVLTLHLTTDGFVTRETIVRISRFVFEGCLHLASCMFLANFPRCATSWPMLGVFVLHCAWHVASMYIQLHSGNIGIFWQPVGLIQRLILGLIVCNARVTCFANVLLLIGQGAIVSSLHMTTEERHSLFGVLLFGTALVCLTFLALEQVVWTVSRYILQVKASSNTESTVKRILSALCDAVVTLGPDLRISTRTPKLANLLLQGRNHTRALEGSLFSDFMVETDQVRFREFLARAPDLRDSCDEPLPAQALNVSLRDSIGTGVQVQLFHSHFQDDNDQIGHLIGICEVGDSGGQTAERVMGSAPVSHLPSRERQEMDSLSDPSNPGDSVSVILAAQGPYGTGELPGPAANRRASSARGQASADQVPPLRGHEEEQLQRGLQPRECSMSFDTLRFAIWQQQATSPVLDASLMERESLQQWVAEWISCRAWVQDLLNAAMRPVSAASWPARGGPPSHVSFHVAFRGTCALPADFLAECGRQEPSPAETGTLRRRPGVGAASGAGPPVRLRVSHVKLNPNRSRSAGALRQTRRLLAHAPGQPALIGTSLSGTTPPSSARGTSAARFLVAEEVAPVSQRMLTRKVRL